MNIEEMSDIIQVGKEASFRKSSATNVGHSDHRHFSSLSNIFKRLLHHLNSDFYVSGQNYHKF